MSFSTAVTVETNITHAVVIGSGFAGLLAARVLADHFDQVTIIERDQLSETSDPRRGVPQSYHPHVLLVRGQQILQDLFPGLPSELVQNGSSWMDWTADLRLRLMGAWAPRFASGIRSIVCTRGLLEAIIRQRVKCRSNITFQTGYQVNALLGDNASNTVCGVKVRNSQGQEIDIAAHFVVDGSGRCSKAPKWLTHLGYEAPQDTSVKSFLGYATRWYKCLSEASPNYTLLYVMPQAPNHSRGAVVHHVEGDRWFVNMIGIGRDYPPTNEAEFLEFARTMEHPAIYDAIKQAEPISPIYSYRRTDNRWRHYEKLPQLPSNFIALGDAVCAFNPVYGQGITVAALGARTLKTCLERKSYQHKTFSQYFHKQLARTNQLPWLMATGDDLRWPSTEGCNPNFITKVLQKYIDRVMKAATQDQRTFKILIEVMQYIYPFSHLFHPYVLWQLFRQRLILPLNLSSSSKTSSSAQNDQVRI